jgi:hypothetical protein
MDEKKQPVIACPKSMIDVVVEDTKRLGDWTQALIRDHSTKEHDWEWSNYHSKVTILCEYYVSLLGLNEYLSEMIRTRDVERLDDGTEYYALSNLDISLVSNLMKTMKFCENELVNAYNVSLQLH